MSIEIANESGVGVDEVDLAALARHVLDGMRMHPLAELSVLLVDRATMSDLHERWMGEPGPTDVLAFPMDELRPPPPGSARGDQGGGGEAGAPPGLLGDVVLCPEVAAKQAAQAQHELRDELELLCTHGILHLLGYDHVDADEHAVMFGLQDELLSSWRSAREPAAGPGAEAGADPAAGTAGALADGPAGTPGDGPAGGPASGPARAQEGRDGSG